MEKSIHTDEYAVFTSLLRETRQAANVTQVELADRVGQQQSFISKVERGELRLDVIQLRTICLALGTTATEFMEELEKRLNKGPRKRTKPGK